MSESISQFPAPTFPAQGNTGDLMLATQGSSGPGTGTTRKLTLRQVFQAGAHVYFPQQFGAIGDGSSHPASASGFGSLTSLQATYPFATALTNEMDWLGHQAAINAATTKGGTIYTPAGNYQMTNSNSAADGSGTLTFPEVGDWYSSGSTIPQVNWIGDGAGPTVIRWANDLGTGKFGVTFANRATTTLGSSGFFQDLAFEGPYLGVGFGQKPANMHGIGWAARRKMLRCKIFGFNGGLCICGDQTLFIQVEVQACYYGIYFDVYNTSLYGNHVFIKCLSENCKEAAVAVSNSSLIGDSEFLSCAFTGSPFGIFKETGGTQSQVLYGCSFRSTQFEALGNGMISDGLASGSHVATILRTVFENCEFQWDSGFKDTGMPATAIIAVAEMQQVTFRGFMEPQLWQPGSATMFDSDSVSQVHMSGDIDTLVGNMGSLPFATIANIDGTYWTVEQTGKWSGRVFGKNNAVTVAAGDVLVLSAANFVQRAAGTNTERFIGIAQNAPNTATAYAPIVVATRGNVDAVTMGSPTPAVGNLLRTATGGTAIAATGFADTTSPQVGYCYWIGTGTGSVHLVPAE